jgi:transcriptional regulator with PAS, ATPase and Fis domain
MLLQQRWEGNVRELQNCIERAVTWQRTAPASRSKSMRAPWAASVKARRTGATLHETLEAVERDEVRRALEASGGRVTLAAQALGVSRQHCTI